MEPPEGRPGLVAMPRSAGSNGRNATPSGLSPRRRGPTHRVHSLVLLELGWYVMVRCCVGPPVPELVTATNTLPRVTA